MGNQKKNKRKRTRANGRSSTRHQGRGKGKGKAEETTEEESNQFPPLNSRVAGPEDDAAAMIARQLQIRAGLREACSEELVGGCVLANLTEVDYVQGYSTMVLRSKRARINDVSYPLLSVTTNEPHNYLDEHWQPLRTSNASLPFIVDSFTLELIQQCDIDLMVSAVEDKEITATPLNNVIRRGFKEVTIAVCFKPPSKDEQGNMLQWESGYENSDKWKKQFYELMMAVSVKAKEARRQAEQARAQRIRNVQKTLMQLKGSVRNPEHVLNVGKVIQLTDMNEAVGLITKSLPLPKDGSSSDIPDTPTVLSAPPPLMQQLQSTGEGEEQQPQKPTILVPPVVPPPSEDTGIPLQSSSKQQAMMNYLHSLMAIGTAHESSLPPTVFAACTEEQDNAMELA
jgi:hypothetical protein